MLVYRTGRLVSQSAEAGKCDLIEQFAALFAVVAMSRISYQAILALQVSGSGRDAFGVMRTQFAGGKHSTLRLRREHMARRFCFSSRIFRINGIGSVTPRPFQTNHAARSPGCRYDFEGKRFVWILSDPGYSVLILAIWRSFRNVLLIQQADRSDESYTL